MTYEVQDMVEITLPDPQTFLKVKETLTRIGVSSKKENVLYQSCHILHKQGRYFVCHFKEMFALDGKPTNFTENDIARRNTIANLLEQWGLVKLVDPNKSKAPIVPINQLKIVKFKEKDTWTFIPKYSIGNKKKPEETA